MTDIATTVRAPSLTAARGLAERIDLPRRVAFLAAASMIAIVALLFFFIAWQGIQLFIADHIPVTRILGTDWADPNTGAPLYGLLPFILGTVYVTVLALVISAPLSVGLALFLSEVAPRWARAIVQPALEIFVGIPSVVWGWLGLTTLVPFLGQTFHRPIVVALPVVGEVFRMPGFFTGNSWFAGSVVLSLMILPTITSVAYDTFRAVPQDLRTGSLALGTTRWQTIRHILIPAALPGVLTAIVLGMTRAAGEALAISMVVGGNELMPRAITLPISTLTSWLTQSMGEAGGAEKDALWTMSLVLLAIAVVSVVLVRRIGGSRREMA